MEIEDRIKKVQQGAKELLGNSTILDLSKDDVIELKNLSMSNNGNVEILETTLEKFKSYLKYKAKLRVIKEDCEFLQQISKELKEQKIRRTDGISNPLFKIIRKDGENDYFITRISAKKQLETTPYFYKDTKILEIVSNSNRELEKLLDIIERNF